MSEETPAPAVAQADAVSEPDLAAPATASPVTEAETPPVTVAEPTAVAPSETAPAPAPSVGSILRTAREARNLAVADVAKSLKLSARQIEALEAGDWSRLPGMTFVRGFARNYARLLQIDASVVLAALDAEKPAAEPVKLALPPSEGATLPQAGRPERRDLVVVLTGVLLVVAALAVYFLMPQGFQGEPEKAAAAKEDVAAEPAPAEAAPEPAAAPAPEAAPAAAVPASAPSAGATSTAAASPVSASAAPVTTPTVSPAPATATPAATPTAPAPAADARKAPTDATVKPAPSPAAAAASPVSPAPAVAAPASATPAKSASAAVTTPAAPAASAAASAPAGADASLVFSFAKPAWVEVRDRSGQVVFSQLSPAGSERRVEGRSPFTLVVGNATHVVLRYKGKPVDMSNRSKDDVARLTLE